MTINHKGWGGKWQDRTQPRHRKELNHNHFLLHNLRRSRHNILTLFAIAWPHHFCHVVNLPRHFVAAHLLALVGQLAVGKVLIVEREGWPRATRRCCRLLQRTACDAMMHKVRCRFVVCGERHKCRRRIDSFTEYFLRSQATKQKNVRFVFTVRKNHKRDGGHR